MSLIRRRDRVVAAIANVVLRFASKDYRRMIAGAVTYGLDSAARDSVECRPAPAPWRVLANTPPAADPDCHCESRPNEYRGRDGYWHCFNCDGRVEVES